MCWWYESSNNIDEKWLQLRHETRTQFFGPTAADNMVEYDCFLRFGDAPTRICRSNRTISVHYTNQILSIR